MTREEGYIYFIQRKSGGPIKIGYTSNPYMRLAFLMGQTKWYDLELKAVLPSFDVRGDEKNLHSWCSPHSTTVTYQDGTESKEWFKDTIWVRRFMYQAQRGEKIPRAYRPRWIKHRERDLRLNNDTFARIAGYTPKPTPEPRPVIIRRRTPLTQDERLAVLSVMTEMVEVIQQYFLERNEILSSLPRTPPDRR